ncbi:MAG: ABC transporter substrate-binding protein [Variibacter sp.]
MTKFKTARFQTARIKTACIALAIALAAPAAARAEVSEVTIPKGAGGFGFLPLVFMEKYRLIEKHAKEAGLDLKVQYLNLGGPSTVNDALISGSAHLAPAGPPAFLTTWAKTQGSMKIKGVAAMSSMPMYLNTRSPDIKSLDDVKGDDKIAITAVKVSIPAIIMQMYARAKYGPAETTRFDKYTVSLTHPDGVAAMLSGHHEVNLHYTSPPFFQRELRDPNIRTIQTTDQVMGGATTFTMLYTTSKFHDENPKTYGALLAALTEAIAMINKDKRNAAKVFLESSSAKGWTEDEIFASLSSPDIKFTTSPQNVMKYANFMADIGTLKMRPASWKELFFPEIHAVEGN